MIYPSTSKRDHWQHNNNRAQQAKRTPVGGKCYPVVDRRGKLVGTLSLDDVREALWQPDLKHLLIAKDLARPNTVKLFDTEPLNLALRKFVDSERAELPVVDSNNEDRVVGVLNRHDLIVAYNRQMQKYIKD